VGCIVPSGIATDDTTKSFFQDLIETGSLVSLYDFENHNGISPAGHRSYWRRKAGNSAAMFSKKAMKVGRHCMSET